jgi:hypothetical protein
MFSSAILSLPINSSNVVRAFSFVCLILLNKVLDTTVFDQRIKKFFPLFNCLEYGIGGSTHTQQLAQLGIQKEEHPPILSPIEEPKVHIPVIESVKELHKTGKKESIWSLDKVLVRLLIHS